MRKWLPVFLAMILTAAISVTGASAGEEMEPTTTIQEAVAELAVGGAEETEAPETEFSPYFSLDEITEITPNYEEPDKSRNIVVGVDPAPKELGGKTADEMSVAEASSAQFIWESILFGHSFVLEEVNGEPFSSARPVVLDFARDGGLSGRICNQFQARPEYSNTVFQAANVSSTRMMCPDERLAKLESDFLRDLERGIGYYFFGDNLELRRDALVMRFRPATPPASSRPQDVPSSTAVAAPVAPAPAPAPVAVAPAAVPQPVRPARPPVAPPVVAASPPPSVQAGLGEKDLAGRHFVLAKVDGGDFMPDMGEQPYIQFDQGMRVSGKACNSFRGPGELRNGMLVVENAASTMMMCVDAKLNQYETELYAMLKNGARIGLDGSQLTLSGGGREFVYHEQ